MKHFYVQRHQLGRRKCVGFHRKTGIVLRTNQHNGHTRANYYDQDGYPSGESYDGRWTMAIMDTGIGKRTRLSPQGGNMTKRYFIMFESDKTVCRSNDHILCHASTLKSAKASIRAAKKRYAADNPRNFRVYDKFSEGEGPAECVYSETNQPATDRKELHETGNSGSHDCF